VRDTGSVQLLHDLARLWPDRVGNGDQAADVATIADNDYSLSLRFQRFSLPGDLGCVLATLDDVAMGAEPERFAVEDASQPLAQGDSKNRRL
jgi:hypothetical protein